MAQKKTTDPFGKYRIYIYPVIAAWLVTRFFHPVAADGGAMLRESKTERCIRRSPIRLFRGRGTPEFGQVVAFKRDFLADGDEGDNTIRRVIGLPGDKIEIRDGKVFRNGKLLVEDYITGETEGEIGPVTVGRDEFSFSATTGTQRRQQGSEGRDAQTEIHRGWCAVAVWPLNEIGKVK
jgi:signal peptidase I